MDTPRSTRGPMPGRLNRCFGWIIATSTIVGASWASAQESTSPATTIQFNRDIRPILSDNCFACHGPDADHREADMRLDTEEGAKIDLGGYQPIAPGDIDSSAVMERITADDLDLKMPPPDSGKELTPAQIAMIRDWIQQGAPWSAHWAYESPVMHPTPTVSQPSWIKNEIDAFVLARLDQAGLMPVSDADPRTLVRRLFFDLTGLPPDPQTVEAFVRDPSDEAYERLVDQLLASPHYGERMAVYWLDLVRYADTVGYHGDQDHNISPYRDYVIDAFNDNRSFRQFTIDQLAGDLLPDPSIDQQIATGYNRLLQTSHEGGVQPKEYLAIYAADRVRNISEVWLGATLGCAQCHDHKYDPYTSKDFYAMSAFFADIDEAEHFRVGTNALPTRRPPEIAVLTSRERQKLATIQARLAQLRTDLQSASADEQDSLAAEIKSLESEEQSIQVNKRMTMVTQALDEPRVTRVLPRGNWLDDSGPIVTPAVPEFLGEFAYAGDRATRLDLAHWLTDAENGAGKLTARVFVNRFWYLTFGQGLSRRMADLGGQGEPPSHPELLDRLALEFVASHWNVKQMMKTLVMSHTYRLSSLPSAELVAADPQNRLYGRQNRFRLPAEMVRDNALAISGLLVREIGGPSAKPYQPAGYYRHLNFPQREYRADQGTQQWRRGVYVHWQRQFLHPTLKSLDAPNREECTAQRPRSNTPLAALALLNDPSFVEAARSFASRILNEAPESTFDARLEFAFREALSRSPDDVESGELEQLYRQSLEHFAQTPNDAEALLHVGYSELEHDAPAAELAAWTTVARALLNLHETMLRN